MSRTPPADQTSILREKFRKQLELTNPSKAQLEWRLSCFDQGNTYADILQHFGITLQGKHVLDCACTHGGHAVACAARGAEVIAADLNDHGHHHLRQFAIKHQLTLDTIVANCEDLSQSDSGAFDILTKQRDTS